MYRALAVGGVLLALGWTAWWMVKEPGATSRAPFTGARLERRGGLDVLLLAGPPRRKGRAHGKAFAGRIQASLERLRPADPGVAAFAIETCGERLARFLPDAYRAEIEGIAEGAGITFYEALYLDTRFELSAFGLVPGAAPAPQAGAAAVGPGPEVARLLRSPGDLVVIVHEDLDPPLVLIALPGMAGGFLGMRGAAAAALRPAPSRTTPTLKGLVRVLFLRLLLERPSRDRLPAGVTGAVSVAMVQPDGSAGTLACAPSGAAWYAGGDYSMTTEEAPGTGGDLVLLGARPAARRALLAERARALLEAEPPAGLALLALRGGDGMTATIVEGGKRRSARVWGGRGPG